MTSRLALSGVGKRYGESTAVDDFTVDIAEGEFVSLLGPSGCGKTTVLRMVAGFVAPTHGSIALNGDVISSPGMVLPPERRGMSMIFQSYAIWPNMTVEENVRFGLEIRRVPAGDARRRVDAILDVVRLREYAKRYPAELSGGQQQRVALARAIVVEPAVLLLDEPLSNLDANLREEMRFEIRRMHDEYRITTVYVTHDQSEAMVTSDRIVVMNRGRIEQIDSPVRLYEMPRTPFVASFIGKTNLLAGEHAGGDVRIGELRLPASRFGRPLAAGRLALSMRPQHVRLIEASAQPSPGEVIAEGRVTGVAYLGGSFEYILDLGMGSPVIALSDTLPPLARGERIRAAIDPARIAVVGD